MWDDPLSVRYSACLVIGVTQSSRSFSFHEVDRFRCRDLLDCIYFTYGMFLTHDVFDNPIPFSFETSNRYSMFFSSKDEVIMIATLVSSVFAFTPINFKTLRTVLFLLPRPCQIMENRKFILKTFIYIWFLFIFKPMSLLVYWGLCL